MILLAAALAAAKPVSSAWLVGTWARVGGKNWPTIDQACTDGEAYRFSANGRYEAFSAGGDWAADGRWQAAGGSTTLRPIGAQDAGKITRLPDGRIGIAFAGHPTKVLTKCPSQPSGK